MAYNRFKVALEIQDAGNLRAIAREFVKVVDNAMEELQVTTKVWEDAAVVLLVNKLESLCHSEQRFSKAYEDCKLCAEHEMANRSKFRSIPLTRHGNTIFIPLPRESWELIDGGCSCEHCKGKQDSYWDTIAIHEKTPKNRRDDYTTLVHYPELHKF